jgi:lysophospholipase L1-like esterase
MNAQTKRVFLGALALFAWSVLGCGSDTTLPAPGSGGTTGSPSGGTPVNSSGGASTAPLASGGVVTSGGTVASGGTTSSLGGTPAKGGAVTGGTTSSGGQPASGGKASGGAASGGNATGGKATGGSATGGGATGGSETGGSEAGGSAADAAASGGTTADASAGGKTAAGGSSDGPDGAATGGKTAAGGSASGGAAGGGAAGGGPPLGGGKGSSDGKTPITVWMAGDSTMQGDTIDTTACASCPCGWGAQFSTAFNSNVKVIDRAVSGTSIKSWLYANVSTQADASGECVLTNTNYSANWNAMLDANTGMKPGDYLIVEFGINDGSDCSKGRHVGIELFKTYLTTMAQAASDRGAEAIFLTPTNAIMCTGSTANTNTRGQYPAATIAAGAADGVPVIDVTTLSAALYTSAGLCPNSNDYTSTTSKVGQFFCGDHTHFEKAGALQIVQMVAKALKDQGIGLASYLIN